MLQIPIRRSGNRENLFLGCDRELIMVTALITFTLIFATQNIWAMVVGGALWFLALKILRKMAKADPKMRDVYMRHRRYKRFYPAHSTPFRVNTESQGKRYK